MQFLKIQNNEEKIHSKWDVTVLNTASEASEGIWKLGLKPAFILLISDILALIGFLKYYFKIVFICELKTQ